MKNHLMMVMLFLCSMTSFGSTYFISPTGNDNNPGTINLPFASFSKLSAVLVSGDTAWARGGTYRSTNNAATIFFWLHNLTGTALRPIYIAAYQNEKPVFNLDNITPTASRPYGMALSGCTYIHMKGFAIKNLRQKAGDGFSRGFYLYQSPNCEIELFEIFNIGGGGLGIEQSSGTYVLNCDVHHCGDGLPTASSAWNGGDCYNCTGGDRSTDLVFEGCRGWMTGDDIWDFFGWNGDKITMKNCWAFWASVKPWGINGQEPTEAPYNPATGMGMTPNDASTWINPTTHAWNAAWCTASNSGEGFKLGGGTIAYGNIPAPTTTKKFIYNCLGFENRGNGFSANMQADASHRMLMENCAAYGNYDGGWSFGTGRCTGIKMIMKNCWAYHNGATYGGWTANGDWVYDGLPDSVSNNYWDTHYYGNVNYGNLKPDPIAQLTDADFLSVTSSGVTGPRQADGSLPNINFAHPSSTSKLIDKGVSTGLPFNGSAPDLGSFEYRPSPTNIAPVANANVDQTVALPQNSVILSGSGTDPDGTIIGYIWTKISGPVAGSISNATAAITDVTGMVQGTYSFELKVTDNLNATGRDTMRVNILPPVNLPPVANAGADQDLMPPVNAVTLTGSGTDPDGIITGYRWAKVSGPTPVTISGSATQTAIVSGLVNGKYKFELVVIDNSGNIGRDTVNVNIGSVITPVTLTGFSAIAKPNLTNFLQWETATEINSDYFMVERSTDGGHFTQVAIVNANGNSNSILHYQLTDYFPESGLNYYRLKMVDKDGQFQYSFIVSVILRSTATGKIEIISAGTNHHHLAINIKSNKSQNANYMVYDAGGRMLCQSGIQLREGTNLISKDLPLPGAVYFFKLLTQEEQVSIPLVKSN